MIPDSSLDEMGRFAAPSERGTAEIALTNSQPARIITIAIRERELMWGYRLEVRTRDFQSLSRGSIPRIPIPFANFARTLELLLVTGEAGLFAWLVGNGVDMMAIALSRRRGGEMADTYA